MCDRCDACNQEGLVATGCRLCGKSSYCDDECANQDWATHALECNIERVASLGVIMAVPYAYQDVLDAKHYETTDLVTESYLSRHVNSSGLISTRVTAYEEPYLLERVDDAKPPQVKFSIQVNGKRVTDVTAVKNGIIANKMPGVCGKLAAQRTAPAPGSTTYWVPMAAPVELVDDAPVSIALVEEPSGRIVSSHTLQVPSELAAARTLSRKARAPVAYQLQEKRLSVTNTVPLVAQCPDAVIRLAIDPSTYTLMDVEYQLGAGLEAGDWDQVRFHCDATDIDQVAGLVMAMSQRIDAVNQQDYSIIYDHLQQLHKPQQSGSAPSAKVNAAINRAVQAQFDQVNGPISYLRDANAIRKLKRAKNGAELYSEFERHLSNAEDGASGEGQWTESRLLANVALSALKTMQGFRASDYPTLKELEGRLQTLKSQKWQTFKGRTQRRWEKGKQAKTREQQKLQALKEGGKSTQSSDTYAQGSGESQ